MAVGGVEVKHGWKKIRLIGVEKASMDEKT